MGFLGSVVDRENRAFVKMERSLAEIDQLISSSSPDAEQRLERLVLEINEIASQVANMKPEFSALISKVALREIALKSYKKAVELARSASKLDPDNTDARFSLSMAMRHAGMLDDAGKEIDSAIKLAPKEKRFRMEKGRILLAKGDKEGAKASFVEASKIDPADIEIYNMLIQLSPGDTALMVGKAGALASLRKYSEAVKAFEEAIALKENDGDAWMGKAMALLDDGRTEESMQSVKRVLSIDPKRVDAWILKAKIQKDSGKVGDAIETLKKGSEADPANKYVWNELGVLESGRQDFDAALASFNKALAIAPDDVDVLRNKNVVLHALGKNEEIVDCCNKILAVEPEDTDCLVDKGETQLKLKRFEDSNASFKEALRLSKDELPILIRLKETAKNLGRDEEVISWADRILKKSPNDVSALHDKGLAQIKLNKYHEAVKSLDRALRAEPANIAVLSSMDEVLKLLGDDKGVVDVASRIIRIDPGNKHALLDRAIAYDHMNDLQRAIESYRQAFNVDTSDRIIAFDFTVALYKVGSYDECAETSRRALEKSGDEPKLWRILGEAELGRKRPEEALKALDKSLSLDAKDRGAQYSKGLALMELARFEEAAAAFGKVIATDPKDADATFQLGLALSRLERFQEAVDCFTKVSMLRPQDIVPLILQGDILLRMNRPIDALTPLSAALRLSPDSMDALRLMKETMVRLRNPDGTIRVCNDILRLNPRDADALTDRGKAHLDMGDAKDALASFDLALALRPDNLELLMLKETSLIKLEDQAGIIRVGAKILTLMPGDRQTLVNMALANERLGQLEEALKIYDEVLLSNPKDVDIINRRGEIFLVTDRPDLAAETFMSALQLTKRSGLLLNNYGKALLAMKKLDEALDVFRHAIEESPVSPEYRVNEGRTLAALERMEDALKSFDTALSLDPNNYSALKYRGGVLLKMNRPEEALASFEKALAESKEEKEIYKYMGKACEMLSKPREAIVHYQEALRSNPSDASVWMRIGELHASLGDIRESIDDFDRALQISPDDAPLWMGKGKSLDKLGMGEDALQAYDRAIGINKDLAEAWRLKGSLLLKLEKPEAALRAFEHAISLDSTDHVSKKGMEQADELVKKLKIEEYARAVLEFEHSHKRAVTKEEAFKIAGIPYAYLDDVMAYIEERVDLDLSELSQDEIDAYEEASRVILLRAHEDRSLESEGVTLADIAKNFPEYRIPTAKRILAYTQKVSMMTFEKAKGEDPKLEYMLRAASDLPESEKNVIGVMRHLNVGIMGARRIVSILRTFKGGSLSTPYVGLQSIATETFGTHVPDSRGVAVVEEKTLREENVRGRDRPESEGIDSIEQSGYVIEAGIHVPKSMREGGRSGAKRAATGDDGLDRDAAGLEGRRCLFHGGIAVARCRSCKAVLCKECLRGIDRCPRCNVPFNSAEPGGEQEEGTAEEEQEQPAPQKRVPHEERDFTRL